ncbi:MAG: hypothetical protein PUG48_00690 [Clostridia bacterium]|nr:hypothetical protein [Clostridia bacterium]
MEFGADTWWIVGTVATVAIGIISYFLKRTMSKQDEHDKDIHQIKLTYVTKDELKELKDETNSDLKKLQADVEEIKDKSLTKADFYRLQSNTDSKIDKIYDLLIKLNGGGKNE